jgi:hypothetical protein
MNEHRLPLYHYLDHIEYVEENVQADLHVLRGKCGPLLVL